MKKFEEFGLSRELLLAIQNLGYTIPTQIQEVSIPHIICKKDVVGESATGSGKTLAFGCGIAEHVIPGKGLQALVLTPTRELAEQVTNVLMKIVHKKSLRIVSVYGGVAIDPQIRSLPRADVVVATPGRLLDHLERRTIDLRKISLLVLDEADRMLDMGFIDDIEKIVRACPKERQTLFFSATISDRIKDLARKYMHQPQIVEATKQVDPSKLKQYYYDIPKQMKFSLLVHLLKHENTKLAMIFCNTRRNTDFVVKNLQKNDIRAVAIHGGLTQNKRTKTITSFTESHSPILVCTDVAARGLDIDHVSHIYNYDIPRDSVDYVHRIGRTARAGEEGIVINLLSDCNYDDFSRVRKDYRNFTIEKLEKPEVARVTIQRVENDRPRGFQSRGAPRNGGFQSRGPSRRDDSRPRREGSSRRDDSRPRREESRSRKPFPPRRNYNN